METQKTEGKVKVTPAAIAFPTDTLDESMEFIGKLVSVKGETTCKTREISIATGVPEGSLPLIISTACQYGIMENVHGQGYRPTSLYSEIVSPTFDHERAAAIHQALVSPPLYRKIIDEFNGKLLPNEKGFANYLVNKFAVKSYAIPKIIRAFFTNFKDAIDVNNKLRLIEPLKKNGMATIIQDAETIVETKAITQVVKERSRNFQQPIPLPDEKMIILEYPKGNMTAEDFAALKAFITFLELSEGISGKKKENET
jgi:hypothetical protein